LREDQLQDLAWRWLIPASLANILVIAFFKVVVI
jgi:NADH:ubiquinone oxidoreductase subunit H